MLSKVYFRGGNVLCTECQVMKTTFYWCISFPLQYINNQPHSGLRCRVSGGIRFESRLGRLSWLCVIKNFLTPSACQNITLIQITKDTCMFIIHKTQIHLILRYMSSEIETTSLHNVKTSQWSVITFRITHNNTQILVSDWLWAERQGFDSQKRLFSSLSGQDRLWSPPSLLPQRILGALS